MSIDDLPAGEPSVVPVVGSGWPDSVELHTVRFAKDGQCTSPQALQDAVRAASRHTHVFLLCHGWNNSWADVRSRYRTWVTNLVDLPDTAAARRDGRFNPMFVGLFWPSLALPGGDERGPELAGSAPDRELLGALADYAPAADRERISGLLARPSLTDAEAKEVSAGLAQGFEQLGWAAEDSTDSDVPPDDVLSLQQSWVAVQAETGPSADVMSTRPLDPNQVLDLGDGAETAGAGRWTTLGLLRVASFRTMKDRAHRVGSVGGRQLLTGLLQAPPTPNHRRSHHLVGHSFGCKVLLSALCAADLGTAVDSALLLQPAISARCFAQDAGDGRPGGYRSALDRVRGSIVSTWSTHDFPLRKLYQLSAWRGKDLGDIETAGLLDRYHALGGFGPKLLSPPPATRVASPGQQQFDLPSQPAVVAVDGSQVIGGHGDVATASTAWMLFDQLGLAVDGGEARP